MRRAVVPLLVALACSACDAAPPTTKEDSGATNRAPARSVRFEPVPPGDVADVVRTAVTRARAEGRRVLVYVGATWCERCQRFHHAAQAGAVDAQLGNVTFVEFDLDRDRDRLTAAGYASRFIPLFALPAADGRASDRRVEGSVKGEGAVAEIVPRLLTLLSGR